MRQSTFKSHVASNNKWSVKLLKTSTGRERREVSHGFWYKVYSKWRGQSLIGDMGETGTQSPALNFSMERINIKI